jgi:hypothetical protein
MGSKLKTTGRWAVVRCGRLQAVWVLAGMAGCEPISSDDRAYFDALDRERAAREQQLRAATDGVAEEVVIVRVKDSPAPDGEGTTQDWLNRAFQAIGGPVMFPRWSTIRRGSNKQEVRFEFVMIDELNRMQRFRYVWDVDVLEMTVGEPRRELLEEMDAPDRTLARQAERRIKWHESQLE